MWQQNSGVGQTKSLVMPPVTVAVRDSQLTQRTDGNELNPNIATLEQILATLARLEARLDERERRIASTLQPPWPDPNPDPNWDPSIHRETPRHRAFQEYSPYDQPPYRPPTSWPPQPLSYYQPSPHNNPCQQLCNAGQPPPLVDAGFHPPHAQPPNQLEWHAAAPPLQDPDSPYWLSTFGLPRQTPIPPSGQHLYNGPDPNGSLLHLHADYHPLWLQFDGPETFGQPGTFDAGYQQWQPGYNPPGQHSSQEYPTIEDVDVGDIKHPIGEDTWFMAHDFDHPRDDEKGTEHGSIPNTQPSFHPGQPEHPPSRPRAPHDLPLHPPSQPPSCQHPMSHCRSATTTIPDAAPPHIDNSRCIFHLHYDPSSISPLAATAIPPPLATILLSYSPDIRYDSRELIAYGNADSVISRPSIAIDQLPNRDQVGVEEGNRVNYHRASVFLEEFTAVGSLVQKEVVDVVLGPSFAVLMRGTDKILLGKVKSNLFVELVKAGTELLSKMCLSGKLYEVTSSVDCIQENRKVVVELNEQFLMFERGLESYGIEICTLKYIEDDEQKKKRKDRNKTSEQNGDLMRIVGSENELSEIVILNLQKQFEKVVAKNLADLGFENGFRGVFYHFKGHRQSFLFSPTLGADIKTFARSALPNPVMAKVGRARAARMIVIQQVECEKQETEIDYLLEYFQKTSPTVPALCENKIGEDDSHEDFMLKRSMRLMRQIVSHACMGVAAENDLKKELGRMSGRLKEIRCVDGVLISISTLRTRWISTMGELIRVSHHISVIILYCFTIYFP